IDDLKLVPLSKVLTLIEGWAHILFGHQLARICLIKKTLVASQMSYHLVRGKMAALKLCPPSHTGDTRGSFSDDQRLPLAVQLPLLPYLILHSQNGLFKTALSKKDAECAMLPF
uniref:Uncharacterized protein n=1 Tax=Catagonus wagneri TaxID=51154 RepID=A0A8C3WL44_9CETA